MCFFSRISPLCASLAIAGVTACSGNDGSVVTPPPPGTPVYRWMNPVSQGATLTGLWGPAPNNLFATGSGGIVLRFDGNAWRHTKSPVDENLNAIWGADATHAFAVGQGGVILFFNGTSWQPQTSPTTKALNDVWGTSAQNVYAVGQQRELIHFDGTRWDRVAVTPGIENFYSIWGSDPGNIYATGLGRKLLHYDGAAWGEVETNSTFALNDVWGTDSLDVFAVGGNGAVAHYDGTWSNIDVGETLFATTVWGTASDDVYAMGFAAGAASPGYHWDGFGWTPVEMNTIKGISGVYGVGGEVVAVGQAGLIHRRSGAEFRAAPGGLTVDLRAVWVSPNGSEAFAVGELGTILHFENGAWAPMASGTTRNLRGITALCSCSPIVVGEDGVVLRYTGGVWVDDSPGLPVHLNAVWTDASGTAFAVGDDMTVLRSDGSGWSPLSLGSVIGSLLSVWGSSIDNVYVVGTGNTAFLWNGTQFKNAAIQPGSYHIFHGVFGTAADDVYVGSELISPPASGVTHAGGSIFHWDGATWTPVFSDPIHDVLSVWRYGKSGFATGDSNTLLRDPAGAEGWGRVPDLDNLPFYVNSVWGSSMQNVFIVGNDGAIVRYSP